MCGRVFVKSSFAELMAAFADVEQDESVAGINTGPRHNGAPSLSYPIMIADKNSVRGSFTLATWGLVPRWARDDKPKRPPSANARSETVAPNGMFRDAYRSRRCLMPVNGYFEWKGIKGKKQPYALAMADDKPFCIAAIWEPRRDKSARPGTEENTFAVVTCPPNDLVATIHDRMPVILHERDYARWLGDEPNPADLMVPFPSELMKIWPVSMRVNNARNEGADLLDPIEPEEPSLL
jgi:putative SOS response-associated peptidase YedK